MKKKNEEVEQTKPIKTMKKLLYILSTVILFFFSAMSNVYAIGNEFKLERYAFGATWVLFSLLILITFVIWKRKSKAIREHANNFRVKTYEVIRHGKRMVVTKKISAEPTKK
jgi:hypothetical protein